MVLCIILDEHLGGDIAIIFYYQNYIYIYNHIYTFNSTLIILIKLAITDHHHQKAESHVRNQWFIKWLGSEGVNPNLD